MTCTLYTMHRGCAHKLYATKEMHSYSAACSLINVFAPSCPCFRSTRLILTGKTVCCLCRLRVHIYPLLQVQSRLCCMHTSCHSLLHTRNTSSHIIAREQPDNASQILLLAKVCISTLHSRQAMQTDLGFCCIAHIHAIHNAPANMLQL